MRFNFTYFSTIKLITSGVLEFHDIEYGIWISAPSSPTNHLTQHRPLALSSIVWKWIGLISPPHRTDMPSDRSPLEYGFPLQCWAGGSLLWMVCSKFCCSVCWFWEGEEGVSRLYIKFFFLDDIIDYSDSSMPNFQEPFDISQESIDGHYLHLLH